ILSYLDISGQFPRDRSNWNASPVDHNFTNHPNTLPSILGNIHENARGFSPIIPGWNPTLQQLFPYPIYAEHLNSLPALNNQMNPISYNVSANHHMNNTFSPSDQNNRVQPAEELPELVGVDSRRSASNESLSHSVRNLLASQSSSSESSAQFNRNLCE
ncbi:hypothetical protein DICVIV_05688, partial [Dictyocaulus viviparus]